MFFFALAVGHAEAMLDTHAYEGMPVPEPRQNLDAGIVRVPCEPEGDAESL